MKRFITIAILLLPALYACTETSETGSEAVTGVVLSKDKVDLMVGETATLKATVLPESLGIGVVWSVIDEAYADVKDGVITAKAEGVTYVVATAADGSKRAACMVSVNPPVRYTVSVHDESGLPVSALYGYPGMSTILSGVTSDGETHRMTWSVDDASAGTITSDGVLTFGASETPGSDYVYDARSFVKVVTEDGYGCRVPFRSSLLSGVRVGGDFYRAGTPVIVLASERYPIALLYEGESAPVAVPADGINLELSNATDFSIEKSGTACTLVTGPSTEVSTRLSVSPIGSSAKVGIAEFVIEKPEDIKVLLADATSSTLSFTWTEGSSVEEDIAKPYTLSLFRDADCTDLEVSFSIPADDGCWKGRQPKFVFSGLAPATPYWLMVYDTTPGNEKESSAIPATTAAFTLVEVSSGPAAEGDVILAEDFGQMCWGADETTLSAGYDVSGDGSSSFMERTANTFVGTTGQYAQRILTAQSSAKKESGLRIAKWAQGYYARIYVGPGYLFLSTLNYGTHLLTPELKNIPEGKTAKLKVTLHAAGLVAGNKAVLAVQHGTSFSEISSGTQTNKNKVNLTDNVQTITYSGGISTLSEFEVTLDGVVNGDRIAFGPEKELASGNSNMMLLSDMTVQIVELK